MALPNTKHIAVIGAGIAGTACARGLLGAGHAVQLFDKSRGAGGRLATRRAEWTDPQGRAQTTRLDHGAVGITGRSAAFRRFLDEAVAAGGLAEWSPKLAPGSLPLDGGPRLCVPVPDMPALCRRLVGGVEAEWSFAVEGLHPGPLGWQIEAGGRRHGVHFDAVVLALPPAQAAPLLGPHRPDWARRAALAPMQPCWTLMGVADAPDDADGPAAWDLARPPTGPLEWVMRSDARPGRARVPGQAHWVVHARAGWSRRQLEQSPAWVQQELQAALAECLGRPVVWQHATVHRWRYGSPHVQPHPLSPPGSCWWDAALGLGVCGDFLGAGGVQGVEGAWLSAQALLAAMLPRAGDAALPSATARAPARPEALPR